MLGMQLHGSYERRKIFELESFRFHCNLLRYFICSPGEGRPRGVSCIPPRAERILKCLHFCLVVRWVVGNNTGNIVSFIRRLSSW
jgi:hypothetical protein